MVRSALTWVFVAQRQGQAVARDMVGLGTPFRDVPFFWSQHYDVTLAYVGHADSWDAVELTGSLAARNAAVIYRRAGRALAVVTVGRDRQSLAIEAALSWAMMLRSNHCCVPSVIFPPPIPIPLETV
jgi:hypothetical protein